MINASVIPLWYRLTERARVTLSRIQMEDYGLNLEVPPYPPVAIAPIILSTEQASRLMKKKSHRPVRVR